MRWERGRQGGYQKLKLFESKLLKADIYLLKVPPRTRIKPHIDRCPDGYRHTRLNIRLKGDGIHCVNMIGTEKNPQGGPLRSNRFLKFCASKLHDFGTLNGCLMLSIGWLRRE